MIWPDDYWGFDWRRLRAAALQESHAHRAYARLGLPTPKTQPLTMWREGRLKFAELLPEAGDRNGKVMIRLSWDNLADYCGQDLPDNESPTNIGDIGIVSRITGINRRSALQISARRPDRLAGRRHRSQPRRPPIGHLA
jgi:hypothetical protein